MRHRHPQRRLSSPAGPAEGTSERSTEDPEAQTGSRPLDLEVAAVRSQEVGLEAPQGPNWCVKGDEAEGSWPRPWEGGKKEAAQLGEDGEGSAGPLLPSCRIQLRPCLFQEPWSASPKLEGPLPLPCSQAWTCAEELCRALSPRRACKSPVSGTRPGGCSCSDNAVQPRQPRSMRCG